jgi:hypothetical protein
MSPPVDRSAPKWSGNPPPARDYFEGGRNPRIALIEPASAMSAASVTTLKTISIVATAVIVGSI